MNKRYRTALSGNCAFALIELHRGGITSREHLALILNLDPAQTATLDMLAVLEKARQFVRAKRKNFGKEVREQIRRKVRCRTCNTNIFLVPCCVCDHRAQYVFDPSMPHEEHVAQLIGYSREVVYQVGNGRRRNAHLHED